LERIVQICGPQTGGIILFTDNSTRQETAALAR
jgi:hypothetical protein